MHRQCYYINVINRGHLNNEKQETAMIGRCFLDENHEGSHRISYEHILDKEVEEWKRTH